ncbi:hydroxymethylglutaryl-CoA synthase family protein [Chloroflexota bacterium]
MVGIVSYGAYIPKWRLSRDLVRKGMKGEKAIAGPDEDSVTMAVAAALDCLNGIDRKSIDGLFFSSTTASYREKQIATIIATAADLRRDIITADFANSLRGSTTAIKSAIDAVKAGSANKLLVVASDMRLGGPGSEPELEVGDGAAAVIIGKDDVVAEIEDSYSVVNEMFDVWRSDDDKFIRTWEDRFVQTAGLMKVVPEAVGGLLKKQGRSAQDFSKLLTYAPNARRAAELGKKLGFDPKTQVQDSVFDAVGNTGAAHVLMLLVAALETANAGDRLLLASYGNGSDAFALQATDALAKIQGNQRGVSAHIQSKRAVPDYVTYLNWRKLLPKGMEINRLYFWTYPSAPPINRERNRIYPLHGTKCLNCGNIQFPPQRVCGFCYTKDKNEEVRLSDKKATLYTFSMESASGQLIGIVNFEGGGRIWCNIVDADYKELEIGTPVEMSFREVLFEMGMHDYYWKAVPVRA